MRTTLLFTMLAIAAAGQNSRRVVAIVHDSSRSQTGFAAQMESDERRLLTALPDGSRVLIFTSGLRVRRIFEGDLNTLRRGEAIRQIQLAHATEPNTDLGAALEEGLRAITSSDGAKAIVFFTDAQNRPGPGSRYRGRAFGNILDSASLPPNTRVIVRAYGGDSVSTSRPGVTIVHDTPDWTALLNIAARKPVSLPPPPAWYKWRFWSGIAILIVLASSAALWRKFAHADRGGTDLLAPVVIPDETPAQPVRRSVTRFRIQAGDGSLDLEPGVRESAIIGDSPVADLPLEGAEGCWIQVRIQPGDKRTALTVQNAGTTPIFVGTRRIPSRMSVELPSEYIEARLGRELLRVYPETVVLEGEQS